MAEIIWDPRSKKEREEGVRKALRKLDEQRAAARKLDVDSSSIKEKMINAAKARAKQLGTRYIPQLSDE